MLKVLSVLFFGTFFFAALITPEIFSLAKAWSLDAGYPFSRFYDRVAMGVLFILILILRKDFQFTQIKGYLSKNNLKLKIFRLFFGTLITTSVVVVAMMLAVKNGKMVYKIEMTPVALLGRCVGVFFVGVIISLLEEGFFRVLFLNRLKEQYPVLLAALISSAVYGFVHFIVPDKSFSYSKFSPLAGMDYIYSVLSNMFHISLIEPFLGMTSIGLILCYTIYKTKSFAFSVGLHTGLIVGLKLINKLAVIAPEVVVPEGAGKRYFLVGQQEAWAAFFVIFIFIAIIIKCFPFRDERLA